MKTQKIMFAMAFFCLTQALAEDEKILRYPVGCKPMGFHFDRYTLILQPTMQFNPQTTYFFHNISTRPVTLLQERSDESLYIMHINTTIQPHSWSVLATDEKTSRYLCASDANASPETQVLNCSHLFDICEFPRTRFGDNTRGNYWAVQNIGTIKETMRAMRYHGVILVDPKQKTETTQPQTPTEASKE